MRITAQLIDMVRDEHVWAHRYERTAQELFAAQEEVEAASVRDLITEVGGDEGHTPIPTVER